MNQKAAYLLLVATLFLGLLSCDNAKKESSTNVIEEENNTEQIEINSPIAQEYFTLKTQVDSAWVELNKVEDDKIFTVKRLLQEISFNPKHKSARLKEELSKVDQLNNQKLKQESLEDLTIMDQYDILSDEVISSVIAFKEETPNMAEYPLAEELISDLDSLNGHAIISKRGDYGHIVVKYNKFIKANGEELKKLGVKNTEPLPGLFPDEE